MSVDAMSKVSGLPPDDIRKIMVEVQENHRRLKSCRHHDFLPLDSEIGIRTRYQCTACCGRIDGIALSWYLAGIAHATGNAPAVAKAEA
jgi:hypothetical protein